MKYSLSLFNSKLAIAYGFQKTGDYYILQSDIDENFNVIVKIGKNTFEVNIVEYLLEYFLTNVSGSK